jgi:hypothetical protein
MKEKEPRTSPQIRGSSIAEASGDRSGNAVGWVEKGCRTSS